MRVDVDVRGAAILVRPKGPIVEDGSPVLMQEMRGAIERGMGRVVLDASDIPFVDSGGLEALVDLADELAQVGQTLRIGGATETLREILELTGQAERFDFFEDVQQAARSLS